MKGKVMKKLAWLLLAVPILMVNSSARTGEAQALKKTAKLRQKEPAKADSEDHKALAKGAEAFIEAFDKGNAKALAEFWTTNGDYTDQTGRNLKGRKAIENAFKTLFSENKGLKLRINSLALRFVTPDVALEDGTTEVSPADGGPPSMARYTMVHVKKDGTWKISSVRDSAYTPPNNRRHLRGLEWLIGDWADETEKGGVGRASFEWAKNHNFIHVEFATTFKNISLNEGTQMIGWDAAAKQIRSWTFDDDGGFGQATWARDEKKWVIKSTAVTRDGNKIAATNIVTRISPEIFTWESKDRTLDGKPLPDIKPVRMKRTK
jgi:uncharacterized protein (TIGR02246 family)